MAYGFLESASARQMACVSAAVAWLWPGITFWPAGFERFTWAVGSFSVIQCAVLGSLRSVHSCGLLSSLVPLSLLLTGPSLLPTADFAKCSHFIARKPSGHVLLSPNTLQKEQVQARQCSSTMYAVTDLPGVWFPWWKRYFYTMTIGFGAKCALSMLTILSKDLSLGLAGATQLRSNPCVEPQITLKNTAVFFPSGMLFTVKKAAHASHTLQNSVTQVETPVFGQM